MTKKILFLGGPYIDKTTLADVLHTITVPEYGREFWLKHQVNRRLTPEQLHYIAQTQNAWEDKALKNANGYLLCDTNVFMT